jgi:hypothetical protein
MVRTSQLEKPRSVFIVCEAGSDIGPLIKIFQHLRWRPLDVEDAFAPGDSIVGSTEELITRADVVCVLLQDKNSPNVYLELGYALGLRRPVVIISEASVLPMDLSDQFWIKTSLDDRPALTFQLQAFLANLRPQKPLRSERIALSTPRPKPSATPRPKPSKLMPSGRPGSAMERELLKALQNSAEIESIASQPRGDGDRGYIPDFAIWLAAAPKTIESPVLIEVKGGRLGPTAIDKAVDQIRAFAQAGDVRTGLVIAGSRSKRGPRVKSLAPLIFVLSLEEVQELLDSGKLVETLRRERNRFAHSAG